VAIQEPRLAGKVEIERLNATPPDPLYVAARRVLLDALEASKPYRRSLILVGAQAVYLRTVQAQLSVAPFTIDGDIAIDPSSMPSSPPLEKALSDAGFNAGTQPGSWTRLTRVEGRDITVEVDFMVPAGVAPGSGTRSVDLEGHSRRATRRVPGLEAALVDHGPVEIAAIEATDARKFTVEAAGAAALVVAKTHKIADRGATARGARTDVDKDAGDVYRLMQVTGVADMAAGFSKALTSEVSRHVAENSLGHLNELFGRPGLPGVEMVIRAAGVSEEASEGIRATLIAYVSALRRALS
jgi:hypothetical protein